MTLALQPSGQACGATVTGLDLGAGPSSAQLDAIRQALFEHHVLCFPDQALTADQLERFGAMLGVLGEDPFLEPLPGHKYVAAIARRRDETTSIFAEAWHTDWSFLPQPPHATCLCSITIPPTGGDTLFANQQLAYAELPRQLRADVDSAFALHSARHTFSPEGIHADRAQSGTAVSVKIDEAAYAVQRHPMKRLHPATGRPAIFGCLEGYIVEVPDRSYVQGLKLLMQLREWQTRPEFQYRHRWSPNSVLLWDNFSVLHRATGGYDGHDRLLHRITINRFHADGAV